MNVNVWGPAQWRLLEKTAITVGNRQSSPPCPEKRFFPLVPTCIPPFSLDEIWCHPFFTSDVWSKGYLSTFQEKGGTGLILAFLLSPPCHLCARSMDFFLGERYGASLPFSIQELLQTSDDRKKLKNVAQKLRSCASQRAVTETMDESTSDIDSDKKNETTDRSIIVRELLRVVYTLHDDVNKKLDEQCMKKLPSDIRQLLKSCPSHEQLFRRNRLPWMVYLRRMEWESSFEQNVPSIQLLLQYIHLQFSFYFYGYHENFWVRVCVYYFFHVLRILFAWTYLPEHSPDDLSGKTNPTLLDEHFHSDGNTSLSRAFRQWLSDVFHPYMFSQNIEQYKHHEQNMIAGGYTFSSSTQTIPDLSSFTLHAWKLLLRYPELRLTNSNRSPADVEDSHIEYYTQVLFASYCAESRCI